MKRMNISDEEALKLLEHYTKEKHKTNPYLLTASEINNNSNMPCMSVYSTRLGGLKNAYKMIGIDYDMHNKNVFKGILIKEYINLSNMLNRTPTSRDINLYSKQRIIHNSTAFINNFGSIKQLQEESNLEFTKHAYPKKTKDELKSDLLKLYKELGRIPTQKDLDKCKYTLRSDSYILYFGSFRKALIYSGFTENEIKNKVYKTSKGTICYSRLEYLFARVLENYNIPFDKDILYKNYITDFDKRYSFDFVLNINNSKYFVEIFGITGVKEYEDKILEKRNLCKSNNLKLIEIYPKTLWEYKQKEVYEYILEQIKDSNN